MQSKSCVYSIHSNALDKAILVPTCQEEVHFYSLFTVVWVPGHVHAQAFLVAPSNNTKVNKCDCLVSSSETCLIKLAFSGQ